MVCEYENSNTRRHIALRKAKIVYNFGLSECNMGDQQCDLEKVIAFCTNWLINMEQSAGAWVLYIYIQ